MHIITQKCEDIATPPRETNKSKPTATTITVTTTIFLFLQIQALMN
jgi:hypothetical protein